MAKGKLLTQADIVSEWVNLVYKGNGHGKQFYKHVAAELKDAGLPGVTWEMETVGEKKAFFGGVKGEMHQFLKVKNQEFPLIQTFIGAVDFGNYLNVCRYTALPKDLENVSIYPIFRHNRLEGFLSIVHQAVIVATKALMEELNQDFSVVNTQSKGFLKVW